jgi:ribosomal protein L32
MSEKRYEKKCELESCGKPFVAKISYARFCSGKCKAQWHRDVKEKMIEKQSEKIQSQFEVLSKVLVPEVGNFDELRKSKEKFQDSIVIEPGKYKCQDCGKLFIPEHRRQLEDGSWVKHKNYQGSEMLMYCWDCVVKRNSKPDMFGRLMCKNCGRWYLPDHVDLNCLPGMSHRFN